MQIARLNLHWISEESHNCIKTHTKKYHGSKALPVECPVRSVAFATLLYDESTAAWYLSFLKVMTRRKKYTYINKGIRNRILVFSQGFFPTMR